MGAKRKTQFASLVDLATDLGVSADRARRLAASLPPGFMVQRGKHRKLVKEKYGEALSLLQTQLGNRAGADAKVAQTVDTASAEPTFTYAVERGRREHYEAERAKLRFLTEQKELLPAKDVVRAYTSAVRQTTERILQIPRQLASELASETSAHECGKLLEAALRDALDQLAVEVAGVTLVEGD